MGFRRLWVALGIICLLGNSSLVREKPSEEYIEAMKALAIVAQGLGPANEVGDHETMYDLVVLARPALDVLQEYWSAREVKDATEFVRAAAKSISEISVAVHLLTLSPNPIAQEGARLSTKNLLATCRACHVAYREERPDGSYRIK